MSYNSWRSMLQRMRNPNHWKYPAYGGAGLTFDPRWESFEVFLADMGKRPRRSYTLDRKDPEKGYHPENCRWATRLQQRSNRCKPKAQWTPEERAYAAAVREAF